MESDQQDSPDMFDAQGWKNPAYCPAVSVAYKRVTECDLPVGHEVTDCTPHAGRLFGVGPRHQLSPGFHGCTGQHRPMPAGRRGRIW